MTVEAGRGCHRRDLVEEAFKGFLHNLYMLPPELNGCMKLNKAFILATSGAYSGLAGASLLHYPTIVGVPPIFAFIFFFLAGLIFYFWGMKLTTPEGVNQLLGYIYGGIAAVTFIGFENWGSPEINLAMALWDMACAVCFLLG
jgi:peptidoglycan/LPS O-acetylase OafA/YrhL